MILSCYNSVSLLLAISFLLFDMLLIDNEILDEFGTAWDELVIVFLQDLLETVNGVY